MWAHTGKAGPWCSLGFMMSSKPVSNSVWKAQERSWGMASEAGLSCPPHRCTCVPAHTPKKYENWRQWLTEEKGCTKSVSQEGHHEIFTGLFPYAERSFEQIIPYIYEHLLCIFRYENFWFLSWTMMNLDGKIIVQTSRFWSRNLLPCGEWRRHPSELARSSKSHRPTVLPSRTSGLVRHRLLRKGRR